MSEKRSQKDSGRGPQLHPLPGAGGWRRRHAASSEAKPRRGCGGPGVQLKGRDFT